jgi:hypothetical protein
MSDDLSLLIAVLYGQELLWCALKVKGSAIPGHVDEHKELIHSMLPLHVRSCGPIVEIQEIFTVEVIP